MTLNEQKSFLIGLTCRGLLRAARTERPLVRANVLVPEAAGVTVRFTASYHT